jgi:serine phosphatase RsbU (regulator of sigma subunit)
MSLLHKNKAFSVRDYLFVAVGILGLFWFFLSYASNEPRSIINTSLDKQEASLKAVQALDNLGYQTGDLETQAQFLTNRELLDSLQADLGRRTMIEQLSDTSRAGVYPYIWQVRVSNLQSAARISQDQQSENHALVRLSESGQMIELNNQHGILPERSLNRKALIAAFETDSTLNLWTSLPDSAWDRILNFNLERNYDTEQEGDTLADGNTQSKRSPHEFSRGEIKRLAEYHLKNAGWQPQTLALADLQIKTVQSNTVAELSFHNTEPYLGQSVQIQTSVLPTGALLELNATYNTPNNTVGFSNISQLLRTILIMLFAIATLVIFYFRIRSRAIDTKPALVVSVLAGLIIPAVILLHELSDQVIFGAGAETSDLLGLALRMGFAGAFSTIGFFVIYAVGDSIMRQYWPEKLYGYDYLRQGMVFNRPVGEIMVRSVVIAFLLCGIWSTLLFFFPNLYFDISRNLLTYESAWPPVYLFLNSAWFSGVLIFSIFAVVGTQIYGSFKNSWAPALATMGGMAIVTPCLQAFGPYLQQMLLFAVIGGVFTFIFLKWDFLTTLLSHFIFICMLEVSSGWVVPQSPDLYIFATFCVFLLLVIVMGSLAIAKGKERQSLPNFVPEYVEELAQEQRIKQELQIAREVQQSFLPVQTPQFDELELAAICKPAYETGGDYYDFVRLDDHRVAVMIGDVSGKGIQAAFYMTFVKGVIHSLCREVDSPAEVLKKTNHLFCENAPRGTFISLVYGIVDLNKKTFHFARAGHNPILRITSGNGELEELQPKGIGIGLAQGESFAKHIEEVELSLTADDLLVLYTDGIVEALNEDDTFYGTHRLNSTLKKHKKRSAKDILDILAEDVRSFIGKAKQHDDMTMLVMKLKSTNETQ